MFSRAYSRKALAEVAPFFGNQKRTTASNSRSPARAVIICASLIIKNHYASQQPIERVPNREGQEPNLSITAHDMNYH